MGGGPTGNGERKTKTRTLVIYFDLLRALDSRVT